MNNNIREKYRSMGRISLWGYFVDTIVYCVATHVNNNLWEAYCFVGSLIVEDLLWKISHIVDSNKCRREDERAVGREKER